ncbi:GNAT family N-acetyltransferase [Glycomyces salinus]|uniref:GNAT family N-acetyltransferase n=1 Tax=Glycomyces salinus TaxID=980294 RepID=UPI0018EE2361|nr:GNAT family N-acetyltransferase [Glycomyces salinus]
MDFASHRDQWGIPHLRAHTARDLAFAQGCNAAADRAGQLRVARLRALGRSASLLGPEHLPWDRFARQARIADTAERAFGALDAATAAWVASYVDGVNAASRGDTPWEPWIPLAVWYAEHIMFGAGFPAKLWRERVAESLGPAAVDLFSTDGRHRSGSNAWLLAGDRTATGSPILAGDPHRLLEYPSIYQQIHLACDDFDVIGLAVPGVPGIAHFGHTGTAAWGITNAMADYQDLYIERLRRDHGTVEALGPDGWEAAEAWTETVEVADGEPETVEVVETARGPVVYGGTDSARALSLRCPARVEADLGFAALPDLLRSKTVADIDAAMDRWVTPVNVVLAADTEGALLHRVAGRVPDRDKANLAAPVPAWSPCHAWRGPRTAPRSKPGPVTVSANQGDLSRTFGVEFAPPHRAERIRELLDLSESWSAEAMGLVHTDTLTRSAGPLLAVLARVDLPSLEAKHLRKRLLAWDRRMEAHSVEAAQYAALRAAVVRRLAEHPALAPLAEPAGAPEVFAPWLALAPRVGFALEHLLTRGDRLLPTDCVDRAVRDAAETAAGESRPWGEVHRLAPWQAETTPLTWPGIAGDHDCVLSTSGVPGLTERCARGPAARWVWDLSDRSRSRWIVPFGAAEEPDDPHSRDQLPLWLAGELVPVADDWNLLTEETPMTDHAVAPADRAAVHEQSIDSFGDVRIVPVDPKADIDLIYGWVSEERARFWGMTSHSRREVLEIYEFLDSLTTHHAYLVLRDDDPVALFQTYEPDADPVGEYYDVEPGDFGVHLLVARPDRAGAQAGFTASMVAVLSEFVFKDPSHRRLVGEPDARNEQARARLRRIGFTLGPQVDLPHKRAQLAFLRREDWERR